MSSEDGVNDLNPRQPLSEVVDDTTPKSCATQLSNNVSCLSPSNIVYWCH